jgi:hypothetical protein
MNEIWSKAYIGLHVKYPLFLSDFNETSIFSTIFRKIQIINFHEKPSSGSRVVPRGQPWLSWQSLFAILRTRLKTSRLMLYREITAVCSDTHIRQMNALCGQYIACVSLNVKPGVTYTEQRHGFEGSKRPSTAWNIHTWFSGALPVVRFFQWW